MKAAAVELGLPVTDDLDAVLDAEVELGVVVAYGRIIPRRVLERVPMVNLHFSLLPRWRGAAPVERALLAGDPTTGVCLMEVAEGLDTGAVYAVEETTIAPTDTLATLRGRLVEVGTDMVVDALRGRPARPHSPGGRAHPRGQDRPVRARARLEPSGGRARPAGPSRRGVDHVPGPTAQGLAGRAGARRRRGRPAAPGAIDGTVVATGAGALRLLEVQPEGKGRQEASAWRNGNRPAPDERLGLVSGSAPGVAARQLAVDALVRIDDGGAYANLTLPPLLERSGLSDRDRAFVTELVYGTTRMRRACDWLVDRFLPDPTRIDPTARAWLRLGAYQLAVLDTPPHAAVGATVEAAPKKLKGLCNAVLRKVADVPAGGVAGRRRPPQPARLDREPAHHRPRCGGRGRRVSRR